MISHPTADERSFFETNGYLQIDSFLPTDLVDRLVERLRVVIDRRSTHGSRADGHGKEAVVNGGSRRILHLLDDDPEFLELIDYLDLMPYVRALLHENPQFHASDAFWEEDCADPSPGWHIDGADGGYRNMRPEIPILQLKVGYYLSDMTERNQGNLIIVPGSHLQNEDPTPACLEGFDTFPGSTEICGPPGTVVLFHNAMWHTKGPMRRRGGRRIMLYYAYEQPWMVGNPEHWSYPQEFYAALSAERRKLFHGFVFDPPEYRFI